MSFRDVECAPVWAAQLVQGVGAISLKQDALLETFTTKHDELKKEVGNLSNTVTQNEESRVLMEKETEAGMDRLNGRVNEVEEDAIDLRGHLGIAQDQITQLRQQLQQQQEITRVQNLQHAEEMSRQEARHAEERRRQDERHAEALNREAAKHNLELGRIRRHLQAKKGAQTKKENKLMQALKEIRGDVDGLKNNK
jgi:hypothetical protein